MNVSEYFVKRWEQEQPAFSKVIRAMPEGNLDYRPHERSTSAGDLAWQLVIEQRCLSDMMDTGKIDWPNTKRPATAADIAKEWDKATAELRTRLESYNEEKSAGSADMLMGGQSVWTDTVGNMLWGFLFDMVHHRGQLSTYLRPMGGKVPAIYGPSADDQGE